MRASDDAIICSCLTHTRFALKVNELSQPVYTDSGVHIILRTA